MAAIRMLGLFAVLFALTMSAPAQAAKDEIYTGFASSVAVGGYDAVAYFAEGRAVKGDKAFTYRWKGAKWRFASQANLDLFKAEPVHYAPQYGGYCAWAVAQGYTASGDPEAWSIVGDRLYLNYDRDIQKKWEADIPGNIAKADANWPQVLD